MNPLLQALVNGASVEDRMPQQGYAVKELAYLAGFLDGEGTFTVYKAVQTSGTVYSALISAAATDVDIITWLLQTFGGNSYAPFCRGNRQQAYQWQLRRKELLVPLLEQLTPYLKIKQLQAKLLLKYCLLCYESTRGVKLSEEEIALRNSYCTLFGSLNSVGASASEAKREVVELFKTGEVSLP